MEPFLCPLLSKTTQLLLLPCTVKSMHRLPSTGLPYFPLGLVTTIAQFPCWLGWGAGGGVGCRRPVPGQQKAMCQPPSCGSFPIRQQAEQGPEFNHFIIITVLMGTHPSHWRFVWVCVLFTPYSSFPSAFSFWGSGVHGLSFSCYLTLGWNEDDRP